MKILDTTIEAGESKIIDLHIAKLHTGTPIDVPIIVERAKEDGPCLLLSSGIHGDEVNGVEIVRQIITKGYNKPSRGTVICMPVINVFGFLNQTREFPDGRDLNRKFPGFKNGSLASRFAYNIIDAISPHIDHCIDYHTGGAARFNFSQIRLDADNKEGLELAKAFGVKFIKDADTRDKSFRKTLSDKGKNCLLFEGGRSLHMDRIVTQLGIQGAVRVMHHLGMRDFSQEIAEMQAVPKQILIKKSTWVRASYSGMWRSHYHIGKYVKKGDKIGSISDPYGTFEEAVLAKCDGYIICSNHAPIVNKGDAVVHLSRETTTDF